MIFEVKDGGFGYSSNDCILEHVNVSLDEPQVLSILGANGAGKTTLLKCMLGLLEWKTGGTFVDGVNIRDIPYNQLWRKVGYTYPRQRRLPLPTAQRKWCFWGEMRIWAPSGSLKRGTGK